MARIRVPLWGKPQGFGTVDTEATKGAVVGRNLYREDGSVVTEADLAPGTATDQSRTRVLWSLLQSIPANIAALAALATDGWIRRDGAAITSRELAAADSSYDPTDSGMSATNVQTAIDELDAQKLGDAPSDGNEYVRKDGAWAIATAAGTGMTLVGSATVAGSAATTLTVSGLDLAADSQYLIYLNLGNATAGAASLSLFYNADTTATNYYTQFAQSGGATVGVARNNNAVIAGMNASSAITGQVNLLRDLSGYPRATMHLNRHAPASLELVFSAHVHNDTTNVTSLTISSSVANSLAVGSSVKVYRVG